MISCENVAVLKVLLVIKNLFQLISILVPLLLIIIIMVDIFKSILDGEIEKVLSKVLKRFIAAVVVFLVPTIIMSIFNVVTKESETILACWDNATKSNIEKLALITNANKEKSREEERKRIEEEEAKLPKYSAPNYVYPSATGPISSSSSLTPYVNGTQRALSEGECLKAEDNCACPAYGRYNGFNFTMKSATGRDINIINRYDSIVTVKVKCLDGTVIAKSVNEKAKTNFENAFSRVCELQTTGINGIKITNHNVGAGGTVVARTNSSRSICSLHAYGAAMDINYNISVNVNGKDYYPYAGQGASTYSNYNSFVAALGKENDIRNVNYILWKYAFEPAGFKWGGNWSKDYFDPMHFEVY